MSGAGEYADFARAMLPAVRHASEIARALEGRVRNRPKRDEETAVKQALTAADMACQEALLQPLLERFPNARVAAEEDTPTVASFPSTGDALVVIDPIDGTLLSYLEGGGPYAVILGLALKDRVEAGVVALPREGLVFLASRGGGARMLRSRGVDRPARIEPDGDRVLVSHGMPTAAVEYLRSLGLQVIPACGGAIAVAPLIPGVRAGLRYGSSEQGISIRGRIGALIAREAGALVRGDHDTPFPEDLFTPTASLRVATREEDLEHLAKALAAADLV